MTFDERERFAFAVRTFEQVECACYVARFFKFGRRQCSRFLIGMTMRHVQQRDEVADDAGRFAVQLAHVRLIDLTYALGQPQRFFEREHELRAPDRGTDDPPSQPGCYRESLE